VRGDYADAQQLADRLPATQNSLAAYVLAASAFALGGSAAAASLEPTPLAPSYVGLGSSLTAPGSDWLKHPSLVAAEVPAAGTYRSAEAPVHDLTIVAPAAGTTVRGQVALVVRGDLDSAPAYVVVSVGSRFVGVNHDLIFTEPLDASTWPGGAQPLQVDAYDAQGRLLARGQTTITVDTGDMTLAEPAPSPAVAWVRRQLEQALTPEVLPGVWEQLRGEMAWQQGRLNEAQSLLTVAFQTDPHLPRAREELLAVSQALGLPVMQDHPKLVEVPTQRRMVALTFDDGPHPKITPWILDQLDRFGAHATFFVVGKQVEMYPELAREILARGHEIGSHTYSHTDLTKLTPLDVERELATSRAVIAQATGTQATLFRPPGGDYDGEVGRAVALWGYTSVFWTCNITSYYTNPRDHVVAGMLRKISPGGIVLLHNGEDLTTAILPDLLAALKADDYQMCTISELLAARS
jgi:peptidoglycan/xylan/chitin deacetylase (PgdA/CDA1 family)